MVDHLPHASGQPDETDPDPIPISALQHAVYCLRQAALIHLERMWTENRFTAEGHVLHITTDKPGSRQARGVRRESALPVASKRLGIAGIADLVEFHATDDGETPLPVEYKRGKRKSHRADEVQLCAQALCLEEMTGRALSSEPLPRLLSFRTLPSQDIRQTGQTMARQDAGFAIERRKRAMKKLLNTLYVTTEGASLRKDGENAIADVEGSERARVPLHMLGSLVVFGGIYISPALIGACAANGITIVLLDRVGRFQARIEGPIAGNVLLRRAQYRRSDQPEEIVRGFVIGKISNQRSV